ncbi:hypothetical protein IJ114_02355 [Candidatus Saccharibacteria bacterium]|nr:hypothetical protein [Candidatus Saccharibacteria bacterium]
MSKAIKIGAALAISAFGGLAVASNVSAWGDSNNGRTLYTVEQINEAWAKGKNIIGSKPVFNSITNGSIGDERFFVAASESGNSSAWQNGELTVEEGKEYIIRLYVHNNNPNKNIVAKDTTVMFALPKESTSSQNINGFIKSSNANPSEYWDYVTLKSADGRAFYLDYLEGSATYYNNKVALGGINVSDDVITTNGIKIGYNKLDGNIPGCFDYDGFVVIKVKPVFTDVNYTVDKRVRLAGTTEWSDSVEAKVGDKVEFMIKYQNTTENAVENVMFRDVLPTNLKVVSDVIVKNTTHPNGNKQTGDITTGINIGGYGINAGAYISYTAEVIDNSLICGTNTLRNWGQIGVGKITLQDSADVVIKKTCTEPKKDCTTNPEMPECKKPEPEKNCTTNPEMAECQKKDEPKKEEGNNNTPSEMPSTGATEIVLGTLGIGSVVTAAGYYIASRKALR